MPLTTELATLRSRLDAAAGLRELRSLQRGRVGGVPAGAIALLAWWMREVSGVPVVLVGSNAESLSSDAALWGGTQSLGLFPAADTPPFDRVPPSEEVTRHRLASLALLARRQAPLIVASPAGLLRPALPVELVRGASIQLRPGERHSRDDFIRRAIDLGYRRVSAVSGPGEIAVRGGIVDVFGLDRARPWRAEWFGDEIDELRAFDIETQTSVATLREVAVWPARELDLRATTVEQALRRVDALDISGCRPEVREAWERDREQLREGTYDEGVDLFYPYLLESPPTTLLDHAGDSAVILLVGGREAVLRSARRHAEEIENLLAQEEERGELPAGARTGLLTARRIACRPRDSSRCIELVRETDGDVVLDWRGVDSYVGRIEAFTAAAREVTAAGASVLVVSRQQHRVEELVRDGSLDPVDIAEIDANTQHAATGAFCSDRVATSPRGSRPARPASTSTPTTSSSARSSAAVRRWRAGRGARSRRRRAARGAPPPALPRRARSSCSSRPATWSCTAITASAVSSRCAR